MPALRKQKIRGFIADPDTFATSLLVLAIDEFGTDFFDWEVETFLIEAQAAWGLEPPQFARDRIWALVTVLTTDLYRRSLETFIHVTNAINDVDIDMQSYDFPAPSECAWSVAETTLIDPPDEEEDGSFSHEIRRYLGVRLKQEGITTPPKLLNMAEYDRDPEEEVGIIHGDDPDFVNMQSDRQAGIRLEIEEYVMSRLKRLMAQLQALPLVNGRTEYVDAMRLRVQQAQAGQLQPTGSAAPHY